MWWKKTPSGDRTEGFFGFAGDAVRALSDMILAPRDPRAKAFQRELDDASNRFEADLDDDALIGIGRRVCESAAKFSSYQRIAINETVSGLDLSIRELTTALDFSLEEGEAVAASARRSTRSLARIEEMDDLTAIKTVVRGEVAKLVQSAEQYRKAHASLTAKYEGELAAAREKLNDAQEAIRTDPLTQLPNRVAHEMYLAAIIAKSADDGPYAVAMLDLNGFKAINDTYGHTVGDEALKLFASVLKQHMGSNGMVARLAGDEFVVVAKLSEDALAKQLGTFNAALEQKPLELEDESLTLNASFGVARVSPSRSYADLMKEADERMYEAKRASGRSRAA